MANITVTEVDVAIPEFWSATALGALKANTVMTQLVRRDFDSEVATRGDTVNVIKRGGLTVNDKAKNTKVQLQTPSNSKIPIVLDKHKEISFLIEDVASAKAIDDAINYVEDASIAMGETVDADLLALYTSAGSSVGAAADDLDVATIVSARKTLNDQKAPQRGRVLVIGSGPEASLLNKTQFTSSDFGGGDCEPDDRPQHRLHPRRVRAGEPHAATASGRLRRRGKHGVRGWRGYAGSAVVEPGPPRHADDRGYTLRDEGAPR